jgi:hypothetical protein
MNGQKHIINRQFMELTIPERGRAQPIQNKTSEIVKYKLQPALDDLFSKLSAADEIIRIDKLVIDLGNISENEIDKVLVERSLKEISAKITQIKATGLTNSGLKQVDGNSANANQKFSSTTKSKDFLEQFIYFLRFGRFPWWHINGKSSVNQDATLLEKSSAKPNVSALDEILKETLKYDIRSLKSSIIPMLSTPAVRKRLVFQFSYLQLESLLKRLDDKLFESYHSLFLVLQPSIKQVQNRKDITESFYKIALKYFSVEQQLKNDESKIDFIKEILKVLLAKFSVKENENLLIGILQNLKKQHTKVSAENFKLIVVALVQTVFELRSQNEILQKIVQNILSKSELKITSLVEQHIKISKREFEKRGETLKTESVKNAGNNDADTINVVKLENKEKLISPFPPKPADDAEGIVVSNAGLVLIHPFLRYFFEGLGLLDKELQFKSQQEIYKAIHLLQYIVTENESTEENELPLNKILCGLDIAEPVPNVFPLSVEEKKECINLIKTVLERWNSLKTTNPAALRNTFLQREGILKKSGESWNITIERNSFDVMLEKLPWSISFIKLPWLLQILYVEW